MTAEEYLKHLYDNLNDRCRYNQSYAGRGIANRFLSKDHFIDYVMNVLCVDPRGLDCHRTNNDWDYEPDNIEFLKPEDHAMVHRIIDR